MKKTIIYIATAVALLCSCNKNEEPAAVSQDNLIRFNASVETRALITNAAGLQASTFVIKDILGTETYIDDELTYDGAWKTAKDYPWKAGTHVFASWLKTDGTIAAKDFFGTEPALDEDNKITLSKEMTSETPQFDFLYSGVALTQTTEKPVKYAEYTLDLPMHHLFSNVTFKVKNEMEYAVDLKSLVVSGVSTNKTATITYAAPTGSEENPVSEGVATVTYPSAATGAFVSKVGEQTTTVDGEEAVTTTAPFASVASKGTSETFGGLIWYQSAEEVAAAHINVSYSYEVPSEVEDEDPTVVENEASISLPTGTTWESGKKYVYTLSVKGKLIEIKLQVIPWNFKPGTETYGEGAIATANALEYTSGAGNPDTDKTKPRRQINWFADPAKPILAYFSAYSPVTTYDENNNPKIECIWRIKVTGDTKKIDVNAYNVAADGRKNGDAATKTTTTNGYTLSGPVGGPTGKLGRVNLEFTALEGAAAGNQVQLDFEVVMIDHTQTPAVETEINIDSEVTRGGLLTINYSE